MRVSQPVAPAPPARPIARLTTELRITGVGQIAIGVAGLIVSVVAGDVEVVRALVPFTVCLVLIGALSFVSTRWMRSDEDLPPAAGGVRLEDSTDTVRRCVVGLALALAAVGLVGAAGAGLAAVLGGVVASVGAVDLVNQQSVRLREEGADAAIYRELGVSPFSAGRRPLYTRPLNDSTRAM